MRFSLQRRAAIIKLIFHAQVSWGTAAKRMANFITLHSRKDGSQMGGISACCTFACEAVHSNLLCYPYRQEHSLLVFCRRNIYYIIHTSTEMFSMQVENSSNLVRFLEFR